MKKQFGLLNFVIALRIKIRRIWIHQERIHDVRNTHGSTLDQFNYSSCHNTEVHKK